MNSPNAPLLIVWCLTYNQKDYIRDTLEGFVMQRTDFPVEFVIHDDASNDGTTEIVFEYVEKYPHLITLDLETENQWKLGGLKRIIQIMNERHRRGKYIAFCEGDDYWTDPNKLKIQISFLESNPQYSLCFHSAKKKNESNANAWINCENIEDRDYSPTEIFINWTIPTASVVCRKDALDFYSKLVNPNRIQNYDIFIFLSCAMVGKIRGMHKQMSVYRIQGDGLTYNEKAIKATIMRNPEHFECLKENFPIVNPHSVNDTISKTYFERALVQSSLKLRFHDFYKSLSYNYRRFCSSLIITLIRRILNKRNG